MSTHRNTIRRASTLIAATALALPLVPLATAGSAGAQPADSDGRVLPVRAGAHAFGSNIDGSPVLGSGPSARSTMCTRTYPRTQRNHVVETKEGAGAIADLEVVHSRNRTHRVDGRAAVTSTSTIASGELLGGVVRFEALRSLARVVKTRGGFRRVSRARLAQLVIAGERIELDPGNRTQRFELPEDAGMLVFNEKSGFARPDEGQSRNLGLRLVLPDGTNLRLARSIGRLETGRVGIFGGGAHGTEIPRVAGLAGSGRTAFQPIGCRGTGGKLRSNDTAGVTVPGVLDVAATRSSVRTQYLRNRRARAMAREELTSVSLGRGDVRVEAITSRAVALKRSDGSVRKTPRSSVLGLEVGGERVEVPGPGESIEIEGLASIAGPVTDRTARGLKVTALRVTLLGAASEPVVVNLGVSSAYVVR